MSMPTINLGTLNRNDVVYNLLASVAMMEASLAHVLNAEGEKMQKALEITGLSIDDIITLNTSVGSIISGASDLEDALRGKLTDVSKLMGTTSPILPPPAIPGATIVSGPTIELVPTP